jgi:hypothetical protein
MFATHHLKNGCALRFLLKTEKLKINQFCSMIQSFTLTHLYRFVTFVIVMTAFCLATDSQTASLSQIGDGPQWKDMATINSVLQQELTDTNNALSLPNLTDWTIAISEAYRSFLLHAQAEIPQGHDIPSALDKAYELAKTEPVADPKARAMVIDDLKGKQVELAMKISFN